MAKMWVFGFGFLHRGTAPWKTVKRKNSGCGACDHGLSAGNDAVSVVNSVKGLSLPPDVLRLPVGVTNHR